MGTVCCFREWVEAFLARKLEQLHRCPNRKGFGIGVRKVRRRELMDILREKGLDFKETNEFPCSACFLVSLKTGGEKGKAPSGGLYDCKSVDN